MAKDTFEALLTDLWAELVAGLVIVTMGYFALNPNSIFGIILSLCGCITSIGVLVYLFRDEISGKKNPTPSAQSSLPPTTPVSPPPQQMKMSKSTFDDDDDDEDKKPDGLKAHYAP
jgi:hypothetical protein